MRCAGVTTLINSEIRRSLASYDTSERKKMDKDYLTYFSSYLPYHSLGKIAGDRALYVYYDTCQVVEQG